MGAIVNRELKQRVRPVSGFTVHRPVAKQDVKHCAKIIQLLDDRWKIWDDIFPDEKKDQSKIVSTVFSCALPTGCRIFTSNVEVSAVWIKFC